jgi:hypothetical protein
MLQLVVEMNHLWQDIYRQLGITAQVQAKGGRLARKDTSRRRPSTNLMTSLMGVSDVLSMWRRDKRYLRGEGVPRVLPIHGKGASLESLARRCAPNIPLAEVLDTMCRQGEAMVYKDGKVALLGSSAMMTQRTPEMTLAWLLTQFRHMAETTLYNASIASTVKREGLFQRQVAGWLTEREFKRFAQAIRTNYQEFCALAEIGLSPAGRRPRGDRLECGVGLFLYRDSGKLG